MALNSLLLKLTPNRTYKLSEIYYNPEIDDKIGLDNYLLSGYNLALLYKKNGDNNSALKYMENIYNSIKKINIQRNNNLIKDYINILDSLASLYSNNEIDKAIKLQKESVYFASHMNLEQDNILVHLNITLLENLRKYFQQKQTLLDEYGVISIILNLLQKYMLTRTKEYADYYKIIRDRYDSLMNIPQ